MNEKDGGSAFPRPACACVTYRTGMSLRDYFAAQAVTAMADTHRMDHHTAPQMAAWAYEIADAMLAERKK